MRRLVRLGLLALSFSAFAGVAAAADAPPAAQPPAAPTPPGPAPAGDAPTELPEIVVEGPRVTTPTRTVTPVQDVPRAVILVEERRLRERALTSALDALDDQGGVWVEKRTGHTSDPVIRGLSGGNVLALVDGNTLSTFWGEGGFAGDDMYGKVDPDIVERIEVVRGPASVLYGSNALGGVVNFITRRSPCDWTERGTTWGGRTRLTAGSATRAFRLRAEAYGATPSLRWLVGATRWRAGDTVDGSGQSQDPTGGDGAFANAALDWRASSRAVAGLTLQWTDNEPVHRYYRPTQDNANLRVAVAPTLRLTDLDDLTALADEAELRLFWQKKEDERRWFNAAGVVTQEGVARWETLQASLQFLKDAPCHRLTYGAEFQGTWGESPDDEQFTTTPVGGPTRKASPDSVWSSVGAYAQDVWSFAPHWALTASARVDGLRFSTSVDDEYVPPGNLDPEVDEFTEWDVAVVGGLQLAWMPTDETTVYGGWTRGFRQFPPHFGATQHAYGIVVPTRMLDPVTADQAELGVRHRGRWLSGEVVGYYTWFRNFQNIVRGTFGGQDWYDWDDDGIRDPGEDVYETVGNGKAFVYGVEAAARVELGELTRQSFLCGWSVGGTFAYNYGDDETNGVPIRHTHPMFGTVSLRYDDPDEARGLWLEFGGTLADDYDRIPPDRLANDVGYLEDPAVPASGKRRTWGLPGYAVWDLRGGVNLSPNATLTAGVENLFDRLYRPAHSRWDAPGRNFVLTLEVRF